MALDRSFRQLIIFYFVYNFSENFPRVLKFSSKYPKVSALFIIFLKNFEKFYIKLFKILSNRYLCKTVQRFYTIISFSKILESDD